MNPRQEENSRDLAEHPSELAWIEWLQGEREPLDSAGMENHLAACRRCQAQVSQMRSQQVRLVGALSPRLLVDRPTLGWRWAVAAAGLVGVMVLGWWVLPVGHAIRTKGIRVQWVVERQGQQLPAEAGFGFRTGDRVGIQLVSAVPARAALLFLDARGSARCLGPTDGGVVVSVPAQTAFDLPLSVLLTPSPAPEGLFLLLSSEKLDCAELTGRLQTRARELTSTRWKDFDWEKIYPEGRLEVRWMN